MKKTNLSQDEEAIILRLSKRLELNISKKEVSELKHVKDVLLKALKKSDETLHNWGFSRLIVNSLCSRVVGFKSFILRRPASIYNALEKVEC